MSQTWQPAYGLPKIHQRTALWRRVVIKVGTLTSEFEPRLTLLIEPGDKEKMMPLPYKVIGDKRVWDITEQFRRAASGEFFLLSILETVD